MYIADINKNEDSEDIKAFIKQNSFGILINQTQGRPWGTHIPLELEINKEGKEVLFGHIAKENPQWKDFETDHTILAIFQGPHAYISSSWYDHENVPTWNYIAVHIYGKIKIIKGDDALFSLKKLIDKYEAYSENPVKIENFSKATLRQMNGMVAFEITIDTIQAIKKLSQNRDDKNYQAIISKLEGTKEHNACQIAREMKKIR